MDDLRIEYTISQHLKVIALSAGAYLLATTITLAVIQLINKNLTFVFYASIIGILLAALLILTVSVWQSKTLITIDSEEINISLPNQKLDNYILWSTVSQVGIGLSYITLVSDESNYKIDLENLKYSDLKRVKIKIIEICEAKDIAFSKI